jgi:hypothetical protein
LTFLPTSNHRPQTSNNIKALLKRAGLFLRGVADIFSEKLKFTIHNQTSNMKNFLVLFREPDGRTTEHSEEDIAKHQEHWKEWWERWVYEGKLAGGTGLTLNGTVIKGKDAPVIDDIYRAGKEIVGGFILLKAKNLAEATAIIQSCPVFEFGGYAEVREMQQ